MLGYYACKLFSRFVCVAPLWVRKLIIGFLKLVAYVAMPKWREQMAQHNVMECLGVDKVTARIIAEDSVTRFARMIVEVMRFPLINEQNIDSFAHVEGLENLEAAYNEHKGVIIASAHYGNWELVPPALTLRGYPMLSIARKQNNRHMDRLINEFRQMVGQKIAYNHGSNDLLAMKRILQEKNLLGVMFDQDTNDGGIKADLFGKPLKTPAGVAGFSRMLGTPIVPTFCHNNPDGTVTVVLYPALHTPKTANKEEDCYKTTKELMVILEHEIIKDPPLWFWVHDRWKDGRKLFHHGKKH